MDILKLSILQELKLNTTLGGLQCRKCIKLLSSVYQSLVFTWVLGSTVTKHFVFSSMS